MDLAEIRQQKGVKKCAIADHLGIARPTYDRMESNQGEIKIKDAKRIAEFLSVDPAALFFGKVD